MGLCIYVPLSEFPGCCFGKRGFGKTRSGTERESLEIRGDERERNGRGSRIRSGREEKKPTERENQQSLLKVLVAIASFSL